MGVVRVRHPAVNGKELARAFPIKGKTAGALLIYLLCFSQSWNCHSPLLPQIQTRALHLRSPPRRLHCLSIPCPSIAAMAPKASKGQKAAKAAARKELTKSELVKMWKEHTLFPSTIHVLTLKD